MTKQELLDEIKNKISMALKDPILQQGFEIICKNLKELEKDKQYFSDSLDAQVEAALKLQKENTELKQELENKKLAVRNRNAERRKGWHNLRKKPQDLPTEDGQYLIYEIQYGDPWYDVAYFVTGANVFGTGHEKIIAWRELPKYEG